jgi:hypothetical protein
MMPMVSGGKDALEKSFMDRFVRCIQPTSQNLSFRSVGEPESRTKNPVTVGGPGGRL